MDWSNEKVLKFLKLYRLHPCIWDPKHGSHKCKTKVNDAWVDIRNKMGQPCTVKELKRKKESLMSAFRGYKTKIKKSEAGPSDLYRPIWFAYDIMNSFLGTVYKCNASVSSEGNHNQQDASQDGENSNTSQDDTADINTVASTLDEPEATISKRRQYNPPELQHAKRQMHVQPEDNDEEDECSIFGKLVAKKMRKLTEDRRDLMMIKINQLFYDERQEHNRTRSPWHQRETSPVPRIKQEDSISQFISSDPGEIPESSVQFPSHREDSEPGDYTSAEVDSTEVKNKLHRHEKKEREEMEKIKKADQVVANEAKARVRNREKERRKSKSVSLAENFQAPHTVVRAIPGASPEPLHHSSRQMKSSHPSRPKLPVSRKKK